MKRWWLYLLGIVLLAGAGFAAYQLGVGLRSRTLGQTNLELTGTRLQTPIDVSSIFFTDESGNLTSLTDFPDQIKLVYFGYTHCPDVCPLTMSRLAKVYRDSGEPKDLQVIMITVDPNDTPAETQAYASGFHPSFIGLSGTNTELANALKTFFVAAGDVGNGIFTHTDALIILDRKAQIRMIYGQQSMQELSNELPTLLAQKDW